MTITRLCTARGCGAYAEPGSRQCVSHRRSAQELQRLDPTWQARQRIYKDKRWAVTRRIVLERDGYQCVTCSATDIERTLVVDHIRGVLNCPNPFDPQECQTLCDVCSGKKDGRRSRTRSAT